MNGCPYCTTDGERKPIPGRGGGELEMVQITPMPAINLTTGERDTSAETPFLTQPSTAGFPRIDGQPLTKTSLSF